MITIKLSETAIAGLEQGYRFYERQEQRLGDYFKTSLQSEIEGLKVTAGIHRQVYGHHRLICRIFPFAIYYTFADEMVIIWAIIDCRKDPNWIRKQFE